MFLQICPDMVRYIRYVRTIFCYSEGDILKMKLGIAVSANALTLKRLDYH